MTVLGLDLGKNIAACYLNTDLTLARPVVVADWHRWEDREAEWGLDEAARWVANFMAQNWDGETPIVVEETWFSRKAHGGRLVNANNITPIAAMIGALCVIAPRKVLVVNPMTASGQTGITKATRTVMMPRAIAGLDLTQFGGPRGGLGATEHAADAAFLAYYGVTRGVRSD